MIVGGGRGGGAGGAGGGSELGGVTCFTKRVCTEQRGVRGPTMACGLGFCLNGR